ncbi:endonuclease III domain-containing protein [Botrimarina sp.]|uniref:endonuclease III domain-containing protein n=1 Tax=Botrimarina sp. TaxID=2795802 RepID=UPI0032EC96D0
MATIRKAYDRLLDAYGPQGWWPAARGGVADAWEVVVGAVLVQHTSWKNVVRAIDRLIEADAMSVRAVDAADPARLADWIRPAGPPRVKAARLKNVARWLVESHNGDADAMLKGSHQRYVALARRRELLAVNGVGPETADAILLYAGGAPVFVVDAYKRRVMRRHGWGAADASYDEVQRWWRRRLPTDAVTYSEAHALLVRVGVDHCRGRGPLCEGCPLEPLLPRGGPISDP